jgi:hypothetical protein
MKTIKITLILFSILIFTNLSFGQNPGDTIVVNTFNYGMTYGSGNRDTIISFPNIPGLKFEKIIMQYNMRCKNGAVSTGSNTNLGCGEWDYSCNTYVHDSSRVDSLASLKPSHTISGFTGATFNYTTQPTYDYFQYTQQQVNLNSINSENQYQILSGTTPTSRAFKGSELSGKSQFLYSVSELTSAGLVAGNIDGFLLNALSSGNIQFLRVKIKGTSALALDSVNIENLGFTEVFFSNYSFATGVNRVQFYTPFVWNGSDNLIVEFTFTSGVAANDVLIEGTPSLASLGISTNNGYYQNLSGNGHIDLPVSGLSGITNEVTVSFWAFGDANQLPANTSIIEGLGAGGERDLNIHLPWSNESIYWDCGGNPAYDRINKAATVSEYEGQWNHWAFVKDAVSGIMQIYLNGSLWHSGTGKIKPIDIAHLVVGKSATYTNNYKGSIDELVIWKKALTVSEIANWMSSPINSNHPQYSNLVAYYPMNEGAGNSINDLSVNAVVGTSNASAAWRSTKGTDLNKFFTSTGIRPSLKLFNGSYSTTVSPLVVMDSTQLIPNTIEEFGIISQAGTLLNDQVVSLSTLSVWNAVPQNVYDGTTGALINTTPVASNGSLTPTNLTYINRWPMKFEIMSFVTPYGINLNMGQNGKTWMFDLTDYSPILKGNKRITMERGGQWQEDMDIKFLFIVGTPYRDVLDIREVWRTESRGYSSIMSDQYFEPIDVPTLASGSVFKVRTSVSGHGQEGEFIPRQHFLNVNGGATEFSWNVWKECGENPVYPQGGTWIYDRAGWCPGMATDVQHSDITSMVTPGSPVNLDYGVTTASGSSNYIVSNQLVTYGPINKTLDASIVQISQPSNQVEFTRFNSICHTPKVILKNTGSTVLTSATVNYWVNSSSSPSVYNWSGSLAPDLTEEVELPSSYELWSTLAPANNVFHAEVKNPNGGTDVYDFNNHFQTDFSIPDVMPSNIVIEFKTNLFPGENSYQLTDEQGNVIVSRTGMSANTTYRDTVDLPMGCFTYKVSDLDDDGISFWANNDGNGYTRFKEVGGQVLKFFNGDFGDNINYNFTVNFPLSYEELNDLPELEVSPNPAQDKLNIGFRNFGTKVEVKLIDNLGKVSKVQTFDSESGIYKGTMDISSLPGGLYIVSVSDGTKKAHVKLVKN